MTGFSPIPTKSGASRASGLICGSWERRRPGPASAASRSLQKIVGAASRTGREHLQGSSPLPPGFPILGVFRLKGQSKRDGSIIVRSCKASLSPVYPIRDAFLAVNHVSCPSLSSSGPRQWGESALKTSRLPGALSLLAKSWLYPPSAWRRR